MNSKHDKPPIQEVGCADFESVVWQSKLPVLVAFWAPWSRPCLILDSVLEEVAADCVGRVKVVKVNADDNPDLSLGYEVQSIPTLLYFMAGVLRARIVGTASKEAITAKLEGIAAEPSDGPTNSAGDSGHQPNQR